MPLPHQDILALEERALNAWPALQTILVEGWVLRFADGYTKRANSVNALAPREAFATVRAVAEELYPRQGLPPIFRLTPLAGSEPDAVLADAGYTQMDETSVLTVPLSDVPSGGTVDPAVRISSTPHKAWCDGFAAFNNVSEARRATHDRMLASLRVPSGFAVLEERGVPIAYGLAVAERGMVGLFDIVTAPAQRRQGYGRRLVTALLAWGRTHTATAAYLQVTAVNHPAIALYSGMGFEEAYRYHYRICPGMSP